MNILIMHFSHSSCYMFHLILSTLLSNTTLYVTTLGIEIDFEAV